MVCPRCGSADHKGLSGISGGVEWSQAECSDCEHRWGDGLPDSQERPLPDGMVDCWNCEGRGAFPVPCPTCRDQGIIPEDACGDSPRNSGIQCALPSGHADLHADGEGARWGPSDPFWPERLIIVDKAEAVDILISSDRARSRNRRAAVSIIVAHQCIDLLRDDYTPLDVDGNTWVWVYRGSALRPSVPMTHQQAQTMGLVPPETGPRSPRWSR